MVFARVRVRARCDESHSLAQGRSSHPSVGQHALRQRVHHILNHPQVVALDANPQFDKLVGRARAVGNTLDSCTVTLMGLQPNGRFDMNDQRLAEKGWFV